MITRLLILLSFVLIENSHAAIEEKSLLEIQKQIQETNPEIQSLKEKINELSEQKLSSTSAFFPELTLQGGYQKEDTIPDQYEGNVATANMNWNLFRGFQDISKKRYSSKQLESGELDLEIQTRHLNRQAGELLYNSLYTKSLIDLQNEKLQFLNNQKNMARKKINAGLTSQIDAKEIELEESTLNAEIISLQTEQKNNLESLKSLVNFSHFEIQMPNTWPILSTQDFSQNNFEQNPKILKQKNQLSSIQDQIMIQKGQYLPQLDLLTQFGKITPTNQRLTEQHESKISLLLTWNLFSGLDTYHKTQAQKYAAAATSAEANGLNIQFQNDLTILKNHANELINLRELYEKRNSLSKQYYELTLADYKRGVKNSADLAVATTNLFENRKKLLTIQKELVILKLKHTEITL